MKPVSIIALLGIVAAAAGAAPEPVAFFSSGDRLPGVLTDIDGGTARFESSVLAEPAGIDLSMLLELRGEPATPEVDADHEAIVTLTNGNVLRGQVGALTDESVVLDTWFAGRLDLRRVMVDSMRVTDRAHSVYSGPHGPDGWVMAGDGDPAWHFEQGAMRADAPGSAGRQLDLPDRVSAAFDLAWRGTLRFRFTLFSDRLGDEMPPNAYVLDFNRHYVQFVKHWSTGNAMHRTTIGNAGVRQLRSQEKVRVEFLADRDDGSFVLRIDGEQVAAWRDADADALEDIRGDGIQFISEDSGPLRVSRIRVASWDGRLADEEAAEEAGIEEEIPAGSQQIRLRNGDVVTGKVLGVEDERLSIDTEHGTIRLPVGRMSTAILHRSEDKENPELYQIQKLMNGDVRAWFPEGGCLVFRLDGVDGDHLIGYSQAFGTARIRRDAFSRIEFNIYDAELEPLRPSAGGW